MGAIAGLVSFKNRYDKTQIDKFKNVLAHRMSKANQLFTENILFIQEQEIYTNQDIKINFDGNIYNFKHFERKYEIKAQSPSELIFHLYQKLGKSFFQELEGSFVFAIYDDLQKKVILVRDQLGEKAVYYNYKNHRLAYASEIKAILTLSDIKREVNLGSMEKYFIFSYVPGEETMLKDVYELLPACYIEFNQDGITKKQYWDLLADINNKITSEEELKSKLNYLLNDSVKSRLPEDENVGVFLSGGIDSSLVAALAQIHNKQPINTYSVHFGKDYPNELYYSSMVAEHIKSNHQIIEIKPKNFLNDMFDIIKCLDDPIGDPITVPNFLMAKVASQNNRIILNGEGGDPCFGGPKNTSMILSNIYSNSNDDLEIEKYYLKSYKKCYDIIPSFFSEYLLSDLKN
ncbi:MAG: hypothetical protein EOP00_30900, partial [Pedobacter sp.]